MKNKNFKIYPSVTGVSNADWQDKLEEIAQFGLEEVAVFLTGFDKKERDHFYKFLLKSKIKKIPFVHLRHDTDKDDARFFNKNFHTQCFNIHEEHFGTLDKWKGYWDKICLELDFSDKIDKSIDIREISGLCVDLSHFKCAIARGTEEAAFIFSQRGHAKFSCNHLNGYNPETNLDKHIVDNLKDFGYLTTLPQYLFGQIIALEVYQPIAQQLEFIEYLNKLLGEYLTK